jgi:hypothetical protein
MRTLRAFVVGAYRLINSPIWIRHNKEFPQAARTFTHYTELKKIFYANFAFFAVKFFSSFFWLQLRRVAVQLRFFVKLVEEPLAD